VLAAFEKPEIRNLIRPISIEEYYKIFGNEKTELIEGLVYYKMPKTALHSAAIRILSDYLRMTAGLGYSVMTENPVRIGNSEPEPDIAIVEPLKSLKDPHPTFAHLIIEISVTTQVFDEAKAEIYAKGNIPMYWNILPEEKITVVYSDPGAGAYKKTERVPFDRELNFFANGKNYAILLADVLK
jgi:Uma2 family endonuclease